MTAALEGGEWSAARPGRTLPPGKPGTNFTGGWVGPRAGLEGGKYIHSVCLNNHGGKERRVQCFRGDT